jgi:hypothetical protein
MVSSLLPFKTSNYYNHHQSHELSPANMMESGRVTISRNFSASGGGKSLLLQTFDSKNPIRNAAAPVRSAFNMNKNFDVLPSGIL